MSNQKLNHSQESIPYAQEEVTYPNRIDGTLTIPKTGNNFPVVLLIAGIY